MKYFLSILQHNRFTSSIIKKLVPKDSLVKIYKFLDRDKSTRLYFGNSTVLIDPKNKNIQGLMPVFYWDGTPNFGDLIGPYLVSKITNMPILNVKNLQYPGIMAVGSIVQMLDRKDMVIWGSGLIQKLTNKQIRDFRKYNPEILSLRGKETAKNLLEAGIKTPDQIVFGDPALILPLFYSPSVSSTKKIGICPHYKHKAYFLESISDEDDLKIIDVQKDMETVVDSINSSTVCISTSLHGLIIAQAYNIPWVWLEVFDDNLVGNDFKFKDFFSTLEESQVSHIRVRLEDIKNIDYKTIAKKATLPNKLYNEELILESLTTYLNESINFSNKVCAL